MKRLFALMAFVLALAAVPPASNAERPRRAALGIAIDIQYNRLRIAEVMPGGSGDRMGVRAGDVITHVGGQRINSDRRLSAYIRGLAVGDPVELTVVRGGETLQLIGTAMARSW